MSYKNSADQLQSEWPVNETDDPNAIGIIPMAGPKSDALEVAKTASDLKGTPVFYTTGPYADSAGNWIDPVPVFGGDSPPPIAGPTNFWTNEDDLTEFAPDFDVAGPHVVAALMFHFEGDPVFTVTHEGEALTVVQLSLNQTAKIGSLLAIGKNLTVESGKMKFACTGGTFGGAFGRANELEYEPVVAWSDKAVGIAAQHAYSGPVAGDLIGVGIADTSVSIGVLFSGLNRIAYSRPLTGDPIAVTPPSPLEGNWVANPDGSYTHDAPGDYQSSGQWIFDAPVEGPIWVDVGLDVEWGSAYRQSIGPDTKYAATTVAGYGQNYTNQIGVAGVNYEYGTIEARGEVNAFRVRWLKDPKVAGSSIWRKDGVNASTMTNPYGVEWASCIMCLTPA